MVCRLLYALIVLMGCLTFGAVAQKLTFNDLIILKNSGFESVNSELLTNGWNKWKTAADTTYYGHGLRDSRANYWLTIIRESDGISQVYYHFNRALFFKLKDEVEDSGAMPYRSEDHKRGIESIYIKDKLSVSFWVPQNTKELFYIHLSDIKEHK